MIASPLLTVLAAERALNHYVENLAKKYSLQVRSAFDPLPMLASEQWVLEQLHKQLETAKIRYHESRIYTRQANND